MTFRSSLLYAIKLVSPLRRRPAEKSLGRRSLLGAMLCIGISLVPLVAVLVISDGMIQGITGRIIGLSTQDVSVRISIASSTVRSYDGLLDVARRLAEVDGVEGVLPEVQGMALAAGASARTGATVRAVPRDVFTENSRFAGLFSVREGRADLSDGQRAVIGEKIARDLGLHAGDALRLISVGRTGERLVPKVAQFTVAGIVSCGYQELDALWVFIPLEAGFTALAPRSASFAVGLITGDAFSPRLAEVCRRVERSLAGGGGLPRVDRASVYGWNELNASEYENFASTKALLLLIMLLIVLVASVNISSALVMIVMERRKEVAILKSVGGSADGITMSFLMIGFAAGSGGVMLGVPMGLLAAVNINGIIRTMEKWINVFVKFVYLLGNSDLSGYSGVHLLDPAYYLQDIPVSVPFRELLVITLGTLVLSLAVSALPAMKAGREKPLDTLRKM